MNNRILYSISLLIFGISHHLISMEVIPFADSQQKEDLILCKKIAGLGITEPLLLDELEVTFASLMIADFLHDTEKDIRESFIIDDGSYGRIKAAKISGDGKTLATIYHDKKKAYVWDMATARLLRTLRGHNKKINVIDISPNNRYLATGAHNGQAKIWDIESGQQYRTNSACTSPINANSELNITTFNVL